MANQGIRRLYEAANRVEEVQCERVFAVAPDFESELRQSGLPLYTLESFTPLDELDLLGLNIAHELVYTDVLQILDLGRIPLRAADRTDSHPLVMAGGEALANPFPGLAFLDLVFFRRR